VVDFPTAARALSDRAGWSSSSASPAAGSVSWGDVRRRPRRVACGASWATAYRLLRPLPGGRLRVESYVGGAVSRGRPPWLRVDPLLRVTSTRRTRGPTRAWVRCEVMEAAPFDGSFRGALRGHDSDSVVKGVRLSERSRPTRRGPCAEVRTERASRRVDRTRPASGRGGPATSQPRPAR